MILAIEHIQSGFVFVSWIAAGWVIGAAITSVAIKSINNK